MPQYLLLGYDGTDAEAPARRLKARPAHFAANAPMVEAGAVIAGGALLDDAGNMIGSAMFYNFANRGELYAWLARDPYITGDVWRRVEIKPMLIAPRT
jgi:uncharacterized protein YciI